jgi:hypothetical protein
LGYIYRTNRQLMAKFNPIVSPVGGFGLDAVWVSRRGTIWFSTEIGFRDAKHGWVSEGDVLSEDGRIIRRNRELVNVCDPILPCDCADIVDCPCLAFGLDALERTGPLEVAYPSRRTRSD